MYLMISYFLSLGKSYFYRWMNFLLKVKIELAPQLRLVQFFFFFFFFTNNNSKIFCKQKLKYLMFVIDISNIL